MKYIHVFIFFFYSLNIVSQTITNYTEANGLISDFVECIAVDKINPSIIWIGTSIGLQKFDEANLSWTTYTQANYPNMPSDNIKVIATMKNGDVWIGTDYGAGKFDGTNWITYDNNNGLINNQVRSIDEHPDGDVFIGTISGLSYFSSSSWISVGAPNLHWSGVNATAFDSNGDVWISSPLGGITHFDGPSNFITYDTSNGILSQNVTDLIIDEYDNKWIGTGGGLSILDSTNLVVTNYTRMYVLPPPDTLNPVVNLASFSDLNESLYGVWASIYVGYLGVGGVAGYGYNMNQQWIDFDVSDGLAGLNVRGLDLSYDSSPYIWVATSTGISKISLTATKINDINHVNKVKLYPIPIKSLLNISSSEKIEKLTLYNNLGAITSFKKLVNSSRNYKLDLSSFSSGIYYLSIEGEKNIENRKIIIE